MKTLNHPSSYATAGDTLRCSAAQITSACKVYLPGVLATKQGTSSNYTKKMIEKRKVTIKLFLFSQMFQKHKKDVSIIKSMIF